MSYTIKVLVSGLIKSDILEEGKKISRKLMRGDMVEVESIDIEELKCNYYRVVTGRKLIVPESAIVRNREPSQPAPSNQQMQQLNELIENMKKMTAMAEKTIQCIAGNSLASELPAEEPASKEEKPPLILDNNGVVPEEYTISEEEANDDDVYDEDDFRRSQAEYASLIQNAANDAIGFAVDSKGNQVRNAFKVGTFRAKRMPVISEANYGKQEKKPIELELPSSGPVHIVTSKDGSIDVGKSLGLSFINKPGQGFNI